MSNAHETLADGVPWPRDQLRDQVRGKSGGGAPPPQDWRPALKVPRLEYLRGIAREIHRVIPPTPLHRWPLLCKRTGVEVGV